MPFLVIITGGNSREDYYETPCFIVRDEARAKEIVAEANDQLRRAFEITRPTWTLEEARAAADRKANRNSEIWVDKFAHLPERDLSAEMDAFEMKRRNILTIWPLAWNVHDEEGTEFSYEEIEERA